MPSGNAARLRKNNAFVQQSWNSSDIIIIRIFDWYPSEPWQSARISKQVVEIFIDRSSEKFQKFHHVSFIDISQRIFFPPKNIKDCILVKKNFDH